MQGSHIRKSRNVREGYYRGGFGCHRRNSGFVSGEKSMRVKRDVPAHVRGAIIALSNLWDEMRAEPSPFRNNGGGTAYHLGHIEVQAYDWLNEAQPYNLRWRNVLIRWYKYAGRGMSLNRPVTPAEADEMVRECREAFARSAAPR